MVPVVRPFLLPKGIPGNVMVKAAKRRAGEQGKRYVLFASINAWTGWRLYGLPCSIAVSTVPPPVKK